MIGRLPNTWKEAVVAWFKELLPPLPGVTKKNHDKIQSWCPVCGLRLKHGTSRIRSMKSWYKIFTFYCVIGSTICCALGCRSLLGICSSQWSIKNSRIISIFLTYRILMTFSGLTVNQLEEVVISITRCILVFCVFTGNWSATYLRDLRCSWLLWNFILQY